MNWYTFLSNQWASGLNGYPKSDWTDQTENDGFFLQNQLKNLFNDSNNENIRILDCCCGNGRHANFLADLGYNITALDASPLLVADAKQNSNVNSLFYCEDYRLFYYDHQFNFVYFMHDISLITYVYNELEVFRNFKQISELLQDGGFLLFGENRYNSFIENKIKIMPSINYEMFSYDETFIFESETKLIKREMKLTFKNGVEIENTLINRIYSLEELLAIGKTVNLNLINVYNNYNSKKYDASLPGLIILFRKE